VLTLIYESYPLSGLATCEAPALPSPLPMPLPAPARGFTCAALLRARCLGSSGWLLSQKDHLLRNLPPSLV